MTEHSEEMRAQLISEMMHHRQALLLELQRQFKVFKAAMQCDFPEARPREAWPAKSLLQSAPPTSTIFSIF